MKNIWKKMAAFTLAAALTAGMMPANVNTGGLFGGTEIEAYAADIKFTHTSVTLADELALNFYIDGIANITEASEYTVNFTGACVDESSELEYNTTEGKYFATTRVYAKDIDKNISAALCKDGQTIATLENYSILKYLEQARDNSTDEKEISLIDATKNFGNASAEYFYGTGSGYTEDFESYSPYSHASLYAPDFTSDKAVISLVLDSSTSARLYVKGDETGTASAIIKTQSDYPSFHEITGLLPQELADPQTIKVGGTDYKFSALSWCNRVLYNSNASEKNFKMAKALMAYYTAAKAYSTHFKNVVNLGTLTGDYEAQDGDILTGTLKGDYKITVADGANILLKNVNITNLYDGHSAEFAGITCDNDATITLEGENYVRGGHEYYPGIYIAESKTLTINGTGTLYASQQCYAAGIGARRDKKCGNINIENGTIYAYGGVQAAGIGGACYSRCGNITISGGSIYAYGNYNSNTGSAAGIGGGDYGSCGNILITGGRIYAEGGNYAPGIGANNADQYYSYGAITITNTVTKVTAVMGKEDYYYSIGLPENAWSRGVVTIGCTLAPGGILIGGTEVDLTKSPYVYEPNK